MTSYSWDEDKRLKTIADRALDFADAVLFFDGREVIHQPTPRHGKDRWKSTAMIQRRFYTVVWIWRGTTRHIIRYGDRMTRNSGHIDRFSENELNKRQERGETQSDWDKAALGPVPDGSDPDDAIEPLEWATTVLPLARRNVAQQTASVQIDSDVVRWFKAQGRDYQERINDVLRSYAQQRPR